MSSTKDIVKAANQIAGGVGAVVAGAYLGPAGATMVQTAAGAVDKLIDAAAPGEEEPTRSKRFERMDFQARRKRLPSAAQPATSPADTGRPPAKQEPATPRDADRTAASLRACGWGAADVRRILAGPRGTQSEEARPQTASRPSPDAERRAADIAFWRRSLARSDLAVGLRALYEKKLRDAGETV